MSVCPVCKANAVSSTYCTFSGMFLGQKSVPEGKIFEGPEKDLLVNYKNTNLKTVVKERMEMNPFFWIRFDSTLTIDSKFQKFKQLQLENLETSSPN